MPFVPSRFHGAPIYATEEVSLNSQKS
jgi:hypothetical protein